MGRSLAVMCLPVRFETNKSVHCIACMVVALSPAGRFNIYKAVRFDLHSITKT